MSVREIPKSFEYTCDNCKAVSAHQGDERPKNDYLPTWIILLLKIEQLKHFEPIYLCDECSDGLDMWRHNNPRFDLHRKSAP